MNIAYVANDIIANESKRKNVIIAQSTADVSIDANAGKSVIVDASLSDYPYHYIVIKASAKTYLAKEQYKTDGFSIPYPAITIVEGETINNSRVVTDWIPCKGETVTIDVINTGDSAITVTVWLFGVR